MTDDARILEAVEIARTSGKIRKGANEVTKAIEKGNAKLVVYAADVSPKEIIMHLPLLCKDKNIPCFEIAKKEDLGAAAGLALGTAAVAVVKEGDAKNAIDGLAKETVKKEVKEKKEELKKEAPVKEDKPVEKKKVAKEEAAKPAEDSKEDSE
ncbi:MAG: ribosomal L7Ae/L30e/S12e/Gadd45 family protein [Candidatus Woesearchaeota archaeon]